MSRPELTWGNVSFCSLSFLSQEVPLSFFSWEGANEERGQVVRGAQGAGMENTLFPMNVEPVIEMLLAVQIELHS